MHSPPPRVFPHSRAAKFGQVHSPPEYVHNHWSFICTRKFSATIFRYPPAHLPFHNLHSINNACIGTRVHQLLSERLRYQALMSKFWHNLTDLIPDNLCKCSHIRERSEVRHTEYLEQNNNRLPQIIMPRLSINLEPYCISIVSSY